MRISRLILTLAILSAPACSGMLEFPEFGGACGNGVLDLGETCDDGVNDGSYGGCMGGCGARAPHCGDGNVDTAHGEECDDGTNDGAYGSCLTDCSAHASYCGDGDVDTSNGEECDDGVNDGAYGGCESDCSARAPYCGDSNIDTSEGEACDDGINDGAYGGCSTDCSARAAHCGDSTVDSGDGEACDDGTNDGAYGGCESDCSALAAHCGDSNVDAGDGEACDDGTNDGAYGGCESDCSALAPYCGDSTVDTSDGEACDDGVNNGAYGGCNSDCLSLAPYCGDGTINTSYGELCEVGNLNGQTCVSRGYDVGTLACNAGTCQFDEAGCHDTVCTVTEDFESNTMPPTGWELITTNAAATWGMENGLPHGGGYSVACGYDPALVPQDEVLISPTFVCSDMSISFWAASTMGWIDNFDIELWVVVGAWGGGDDFLLSQDILDDMKPFTDLTYYLMSYPIPAAFNNTPIRIAWRYIGVDGDIALLDDVNLTRCGNGVVEPGEECEGADVGGAMCADVGAGTGTPGCTAACTLDFQACDFPTCDLWTLVGADSPIDHTGGTLDGQLLEYRVEGGNSALHFRFSAAAPYNPATQIVALELSDGVESIRLMDLQGIPTFWRYTGGSWSEITPAPASFVLDDALAQTNGEITVSISTADLWAYLPGVGMNDVQAQARVLDLSYQDRDLIPNASVALDWSDRANCWFTIDSAPDPRGDTDGTVDFSSLAYNAENSLWQVRFDFTDPSDLAGDTQSYLHNSTDGRNFAFTYSAGGVWIGYNDGAWTWAAAPASCTFNAIPNATSATTLILSCPMADLRAALGTYGFSWYGGDSFVLGAYEWSGTNIHDGMPDGFGTPSDGDPIQIPNVCGNGARDPIEDCEGADLDGNDCTTIGMGFLAGTLQCAATCDFDTSGCLTTCGEIDLGTWTGAAINQSGDTCAGTQVFNPPTTCTNFEAAGWEEVYGLTLPAGATVNLTYAAATDNSLYVLTGCYDTAGLTCVAGADNNFSAPYEETLALTNSGGSAVRYYIVVDNWSAGDCSAYTLDITP